MSMRVQLKMKNLGNNLKNNQISDIPQILILGNRLKNYNDL